jgi:putative peptidoglycan lipid II flippase
MSSAASTPFLEDGSADPPFAVARNSLSVAGWTIVSRLTGLARVVAIAVVLGPTYLGNTYVATNLVPNLVFELLAGSLLASLLVPPLVRHLARGDLAGAERVAGGFLGLWLIGSALAGAVIALGAPLLLALLALGVDDSGTVASQQAAGWLLLALFAPQIALYGVAGVGAAMQNSRSRFALAAGAPALENVGIVATLGAFATVFGTDASLATVSTAGILLLGVGTTASVGLHAAAQWFGARHAGIRLVPRAGWRNSEVRTIARRTVPTLGYSGLNAVRIFAALVVANSIAGGVVAFGVALTLFYLPVGICARPVATALLPRLARLFHERALTRFRHELAGGAGLVLFLTVPFAISYVALSELIGEAFFVGGEQEVAGAALLTAALVALAPGILGESAFVLSTNASYATGDARAPFRAMVTRTLLSLAGIAAAFSLDAPAATIACLGAALSAGSIVSAWQLHRAVGSRVGRAPPPSWRGVLRDLVASTAAAGAAYVVASTVATTASTDGGEIGLLAAGVLVGLGVFLGAQRVLRAPELDLLAGGFRQVRLGGNA